MRKLILSISVSLDGFFEGPDHDIDWHFVDEELHQHFNDELGRMGAFIHGRVTYELMAEFWPTADADPANTGTVAEFAVIWRDMPKYVYSRTLDQVGWGSTLVREVDPDAIRALKAEPGGDLVVGGPTLADAFRRHGLIDEYRIYVHPVLIGRGSPLFRDTDARTNLRLVETRPFGSGVVLLRYEAEGGSTGAEGPAS
ncbi:dihydrofolate reductase family protein [Streptomyces sp. NBC_00247]|uniref:dihydrofolate reductase family protein n=1 Tax=Streptomyces sp. NBC_00247 TaxID=2975689 RepID=UPI002E2AFB71|nr:dihydrofolate reductase family protein [Streptomyces sp. NBC_00247]